MIALSLTDLLGTTPEVTRAESSMSDSGAEKTQADFHYFVYCVIVAAGVNKVSELATDRETVERSYSVQDIVGTDYLSFVVAVSGTVVMLKNYYCHAVDVEGAARSRPDKCSRRLDTWHHWKHNLDLASNSVLAADELELRAKHH